MASEVATPSPRDRRRFGNLTPPLRLESEELLHLDTLRLIASYAIVFSHFKLSAYVWPGTQGFFENLQSLDVFVDVFFVVSGIVVTFVYHDRMRAPAQYGDFLRKRAARLVPLHWLTLVFYVLLAIVGRMTGDGVADSAKYDWGCLVPNFLAIHSFGVCRALSFNNVSWSISAELGMYLLFPLFLFLLDKRPLLGFVLTAGLVIGLFAFDQAVYSHTVWTERTYNFGPLRALPGFLLGMTIFGCREWICRLPAASIAFFALLLLLFAGCFLGWPKTVLIPIAYATPVAGYAADLGKSAGRLVRTLAFAGILTYSLYMIHPLVSVVFIKILGVRILGFSGETLNLWIALWMLGLLPIAYASYVWFERPLRRWLSGSRKLHTPAASIVGGAG